MISKEKNQNSKKKENFFQALIASIFKSSSPDAEKKRRLKAIAKNIAKSKYHNFYKHSSGEMLAPFGKLIFEIYKATSPAQIVFKNAQNPAIFNRQIINYILSERQLELLDSFDETKVLEAIRHTPVSQVKNDIENKLQEFSHDFDEAKIAKAEAIFKTFTIFKDFCCFDYYMIIKKFDSTYREYSFDLAPTIEKVSAEYILDDIKDFLSVAYSLTDDSIDWGPLFDFFKKTQGKELIPFGSWKKIVAKIKSIQSSRTLDLIVQHASENPEYVTEVAYHYEPIVEPYFDKIESDARNLIAKIEAEQKASKVSSICIQIFGTANPQSLKFYVPSFNAPLEKKDLNTFEYTEPLNYLKTFLVEFVKTAIREFYDVVVIRGQWDATLSAPLSNAYQELLKTSDEITIFDEKFSEDGVCGIKVKTLLPKTAHDAGAENIINRVISDANETARGFIISSAQNLITIGKTIKPLIDDMALAKPVIVQNWKELDKYIDLPMHDFCVGIYKKIYMFVQLMQAYVN